MNNSNSVTRPSASLTDNAVKTDFRKGRMAIFHSGIDLRNIIDGDDIIAYVRSQAHISLASIAFCEAIIENCTVPKDAAIEICKHINVFVEKFPQYFQDEASQQVIIQAYLQKLLNIKNATGTIRLNSLDVEFSDKLVLSDENWAFVESHQLLNERFIQRYAHPIPYNIALEYLSFNPMYNMAQLKEQSVDTCRAFIDYMNQHGDTCAAARSHSDCEKRLNDIYDTDIFQQAFSQTDGSFIRFISKPSKQLQSIAAMHNPKNIQYIDNPTEKLCICVLTQDPSCIQYIKKRTKRICALANLPYKTEQVTKAPENSIAQPLFPNALYLCQFNECLADEGNLTKILVLPGCEMEDFLKKTITIHFGNLCDDEPRNIADICNYQPITQEEYMVLSKFGLIDTESGHWSIKETSAQK